MLELMVISGLSNVMATNEGIVGLFLPAHLLRQKLLSDIVVSGMFSFWLKSAHYIQDQNLHTRIISKCETTWFKRKWIYTEKICGDVQELLLHREQISSVAIFHFKWLFGLGRVLYVDPTTDRNKSAGLAYLLPCEIVSDMIQPWLQIKLQHFPISLFSSKFLF